jgi:hypothetical protein
VRFAEPRECPKTSEKSEPHLIGHLLNASSFLDSYKRGATFYCYIVSYPKAAVGVQCSAS